MRIGEVRNISYLFLISAAIVKKAFLRMEELQNITIIRFFSLLEPLVDFIYFRTVLRLVFGGRGPPI